MATVDVDIGGTFTDCVVVAESSIVRSKVPTTSYNLSVGFKHAITEAAERLDMTVEELLEQTSVIRYSTTLAMNTLLQRAGPKLGLITTGGFEHTVLIGRARQWADGLHPSEWRHMYRQRKPEPLIPHDLTVGVKERIDCFGKVIAPINRDEVRRQVEYLVNKGVRGFVVSLLWSFMNPTHEQAIREVIEEEYGEPYLGQMVVLCSSDVQPKWHEYTRTNVTILSAYLQTELTEGLSTLTEELRDRGYNKPLHIINNRGGMGKLSRTRALDTYGAGPVAGLVASAHYAKLYELPLVLASDMGGTSFDYGVIQNGELRSYEEWPVVDRWATETTMLEVKTIGAGGGSIAWRNPTIGHALDVGPRSAGSNPGPACYDLGGTQPTVTDADVLLGYIDPEYFLGGNFALNKELATEAIDQIAKPLGMSSVEAAFNIRKVIGGKMGNTLFHELGMRGLDASQFVLFAYGGAGPTHCVSYNAHAKASKIMLFPYSSVFCALGGSIMDVKYSYELSRHICLYSPSYAGNYLQDLDPFNEAVGRLRELAVRDLKGEGFGLEHAVLSLDLDMRYGRSLFTTRVLSPRLYLRNAADVAAVCQALFDTFSSKFTKLAATPEVGINVENMCLHATVPLPKADLPTFELGGESPIAALMGSRPVCWSLSKPFEQTPLYDADRLRPGNVIHGPAIVEARDTTVVIPPAFKYSLDRYLTATIEGS